MIMNYSNILKITIATSFSLATLGTINSASAQATVNLCQIESVPESVIRRVIRGPDFQEFLSKMTIACPAAALALTEAATDRKSVV